MREVRSGEGYGVMPSLTQHFGLGAATAIDRLVVRWPSGTFDVVLNPTVDQILELIEGTSPSTFAEWQSLGFTAVELLDPAISGPNANPDDDALVNLFEWYFRTRPKDARSSRDPISDLAVEEVAPGDRRLVLTIRRQGIPGILETAEVTSDFATWARGAPPFETVTDTNEMLVLRTTTPATGFAGLRFLIETE